MASQTKVDDRVIITERNNCLPDLISSLQHGVEEQTRKQLENINQCLKYLRTFNINEVNSEVLQWVMPVIASCLRKIYEDNLLLTSTADEDFILDMVKENLKIAVGYIEEVRTVLQYIAENGKVSIGIVNSVPVTTGRLIIWTFEHCKNSSESFKNTFKDELLELFRITQELHTLYLQLLESCILFEKLQDSAELDVLKEVLGIISALSGILSELNVKSMISNWKGYMALSQKYSDILENSIDLGPPVKNLIAEIIRNLSSVCNLDTTHQNFDSYARRAINICSFLVKLTIKLFDNYGKILGRITDELLLFCCSVYSLSPEFFHTQDFPPNLVDLMTNIIFKPIELFIRHLASEPVFLSLIAVANTFDSMKYGFLKFLSISLQQVIEQGNCFHPSFTVDMILATIFDCIRSCYFELYWSTPHVSCLFDDLIVNISAAAIIHPQVFPEVERILLQNVLQEHTFSAMLAIEIWDLVLSNSSSEFRVNTLRILIDKLENLHFGINTFRLESVHLKHLIQRIFKSLSFTDKVAITRRYQSSIRDWKTVGSLAPVIQQQQLAEDLCQLTVEKVSNITQGGFCLSDLLLIGESFDVLSKAKFADLHVDSRALTNAVATIWELNHNDISNNVFKYFVIKLCKITRTLILEFSVKQLFMIFNQLKILSSDASYKFEVCNILLSFSEKNKNHLGQSADQIFSLVSNIIHKNLTTAPEAVIRQYAFEIIESFDKNNKHEIVHDILKAKGAQGELANYLRKNAIKEKFDKEYFIWLNALSYRHTCVNWREDIAQPAKKVKTVVQDGHKVQETILPLRINAPLRVKSEEIPAEGEKWKQKIKPVRTNAPSLVRDEVGVKTEQERADDITEAIANIRSDIKHLTNLLKTEKLTQKNASDLKLLTSQLSALL